MSNEIKKPTNKASEVSVATYLIQQFPEWNEQLKKYMLTKCLTNISVKRS